jgi:uncharacterized protein YndB with AHSA1/START domain
MESNDKTKIVRDLENKQLTIIREFKAPVEKVWEAWTDSKILDTWWAPKPWKAETKTMDFSEGGFWLYSMVGPDGTTSWGRADYESIERPKQFTLIDAFCDEDGKVNEGLPRLHWKCEFNKSATGTSVQIAITYTNDEDIEKLIEMGFKEGFTAALENLDEVLAK